MVLPIVSKDLNSSGVMNRYHRMMLLRGLKVLADRHEIDIRRAKVVHQLQHLVPLLAKPHHDAGLREDGGIDLLHALQQADRVEIARAGPNRQIIGRHRFQIVVEDVRPGRDDDFQCAILAQEIRRQDFDRSLRRGAADRMDDVGEMLSAAVRADRPGQPT